MAVPVHVSAILTVVKPQTGLEKGRQYGMMLSRLPW